MGPLLLVAVGLLGLGVLWLELIPQFNAKTLILIRNGAVIVKHGPLRPHVKLPTVELLQEAGVKHGFIALVSGPRVKFSRSIPSAFHQRLRNVLLNP